MKLGLVLFGLYSLGFVLHVLKRANLSAKSPLSQGTRMREFLARNWLSIVIRFLACILFFAVWIEGLADKVLPLIGLQFLLGIAPIPQQLSFLNAAIASGIGFNADSILDWVIASKVPSLQKELPTISED